VNHNIEALAQRVPSWGPRVNIVAISPWEVPNWAAHITYMGVVRPHMQKAWIRDLTVSCEGWNAMIIHMAACITSCVVAEPTVVGGAAATYSVGNGPSNMHSWTISSELTQFNADAFAITRTAETCHGCVYLFLFSVLESLSLDMIRWLSHMMLTCAFVFVIKACDPEKDLPYHHSDMCML
jgi:hypothetical protein